MAKQQSKAGSVLRQLKLSHQQQIQQLTLMAQPATMQHQASED